MPVYTLIITGADGRQNITLSDFPDDRSAIAQTGQFVSAEHPSLALARDIGEVEFLGAWDWDANGPRWTSDN